MNIIDVLCHILNDLLGEGNKFTKDISNIPWGSETERLVPCSVLLAARQIGVPTRILTDKPVEGRGLDPTVRQFALHFHTEIYMILEHFPSTSYQARLQQVRDAFSRHRAYSLHGGYSAY